MSCIGFADGSPWTAQVEGPTNRPPPRPPHEAGASKPRPSRDRETREVQRPEGASQAETPKRREEWEKLSPEARRAAFREWRQKREGEWKLSAPEREARRRVMRERLARQLGELRQKKADRALSEEERNRLERLEEIARRFERTGWTNGGSTVKRPAETIVPPGRKSENRAPFQEPRP